MCVLSAPVVSGLPVEKQTTASCESAPCREFPTMSVVELQLISPHSDPGVSGSVDQAVSASVDQRRDSQNPVPPPTDLCLDSSSPASPTTNGGLTQAAHTGFKTGKVSPSPVESMAASPAQKSRKGAWERAQEQHEAEEQLQAQREIQVQPADFDTHFDAPEKHFTMHKVSHRPPPPTPHLPPPHHPHCLG